MLRWIPLPIRKLLGDFWNKRQTASQQETLLKSLSGKGTVCNVCGWEGQAFTDDPWHPGTICPSCRSQVRHRMLAAVLDGDSLLPHLHEHSLLTGKKILHFAPERQLRERIRNAASKYTTADYDRGDCDLKLNMSAMPGVPADSFEVAIACDVLEHVPDDLAAMRELHRILRPGGTAILTVPQKDPPASTDEDPTILDPAERELRFGQKDHLRMYGDDFPDRLALAGFRVETLQKDSFAQETIDRHVLHPPKSNPNPLATNHRCIYFAKRQKML